MVEGFHRHAQEQRFGTSTGKFLLISLMSDEEPWNHYHSLSRNTELNVPCFHHGAAILYYKSMFSYYLHLKGSPQKLAFYTLIFTWRFMYNIIPVTALKRFRLHAFFYKQHFYKQLQVKIGKKNQANAKQHSEGEILLFENYSSSTLSSTNNRTYSENKENNMYVYIPEIIRSMTMKMKVKMKIRSRRYDVNRPRPRHG